MKLTFETVVLENDDTAVNITLDDKTVTIKQVPGGHTCDLTGLPEDSVGRTILEEVWTLGANLFNVVEYSDESMWGKSSDEVLNEVSRAF